MMKYFYYSVGNEEEIDGDGSLENILQLFYELSDECGSFLGLMNDNELIIQVAWLNEDNWLIDIPQMKKGGSLQKTASYDECVSLIKDFFDRKSIDNIGGFILNSFEN